MKMNKDEVRVLKHIVNNGHDRNLRSAKWDTAKIMLFSEGYINRRGSDWAWVSTGKYEAERGRKND